MVRDCWPRARALQRAEAGYKGPGFISEPSNDNCIYLAIFSATR